MSKVKISKIFQKGDNNIIIINVFSSIYNIKNSLSTIKKEPVMIKMAPKDTSEYKPDIMPDTSLMNL